MWRSIRRAAALGIAEGGGGFEARQKIMKEVRQKVEEGTLTWNDVHTLIQHPGTNEGGLGERVEGQEFEDVLDDDEQAWHNDEDELDELTAFAGDTSAIPHDGPADEDAMGAKEEDDVGAQWAILPENVDADYRRLPAIPPTSNK